MRAMIWAAALSLLAAVAAVGQSTSRTAVADLVQRLTRDTRWQLVSSVPLQFSAHHPQGMVMIVDALFVSSVEVTMRTTRFAQPVGGFDRDTGAGNGHLFKMDLSGKQLADVRLGEGAMYHPGGIDFDGTHIWVAVAEYRPNSRSIVYRVHPETLNAAEVFRVQDHIGAIVYNPDDRTLHGASWGSRRFYRWTLDESGKVTNASGAPERLRTLNTSHFIDYQDCKYAGASQMLCTGVADIRPPQGPAMRLGGLGLIHLSDGRTLFQAPLLLWTPEGLPMTQNPSWFERTPSGLRAYFIPADGRSTLYTYDAILD